MVIMRACQLQLHNTALIPKAGFCARPKSRMRKIMKNGDTGNRMRQRERDEVFHEPCVCLIFVKSGTSPWHKNVLYPMSTCVLSLLLRYDSDILKHLNNECNTSVVTITVNQPVQSWHWIEAKAQLGGQVLGVQLSLHNCWLFVLKPKGPHTQKPRWCQHNTVGHICLWNYQRASTGEAQWA